MTNVELRALKEAVAEALSLATVKVAVMVKALEEIVSREADSPLLYDLLDAKVVAEELKWMVSDAKKEAERVAEEAEEAESEGERRDRERERAISTLYLCSQREHN